MTPGRACRRAALALAFGTALTTGTATGAWDGTGASGPRAAETRPPPYRQLRSEVVVTVADGSAALDGLVLSPDAARDLLAVLDDRWAAYHPPGVAADAPGPGDGTYPGVGLTVRQADGEIRLGHVRPDGPAAHAGLAADDLLTAVDGVPAGELGVAGVVARLRGPAGTPVTLTTVRGGVPTPVVLVRELLTGAGVIVEPLDAPGTPDAPLHIRVSGFGRGTADQVRGALARGPRAVVLDLRGNPGGLIDEAAAVASAFLAPGPVVTYEDGTGGRRELGADAPPGDQETPLVVLVDGATASAAEVVAAALRDRGRAVIVGATTYGKGSVQAVTALADGGSVEFTIGRWYPPSGRSVDGAGVVPDVAVPPAAPPEVGDARAREVLGGPSGADGTG
ncbi:S41 family peptidase [Yinghuangia sp. ASG 101]|uniref:S41 family peptidase n=1 Tax=Yinghuangia sp. ASG 101 TaxID=2896848 RepID=UPI001E3D9F62|nr:S41 family peptidase [Yinghuangia sp. ASG 101]UGQ09580.1 S41 family peptidase [Yinghuangia sp. ASG 101]